MSKKLHLNDKQREAVISAFKNKITVITGSAGTGKSTICKLIVDIAKLSRLGVRLISPTGKAAKVLSSKTGWDAKTIHRSLGMVPGKDEPKNSISEDIVLIDEISMCGIDTIFAIMKAMEYNQKANIVLVGDKNQLPSVSAGNYLSDIINSGCANVVTLDKIYRQADGSYIAEVAGSISQGNVTEIPNDATDISWKNLNPNTYESDLNSYIDRYLENNKIEDLQVMSPMKKGVCGVYETNRILQEKMAKINGTENQFIQFGFNKFHIGDRVIQIENNYDKEVFNGDMGVIVDLGDKEIGGGNNKRAKQVSVQFDNDSLPIKYVGSEVDELNLAWCITVHKFQGSQSDNILLIMANEANILFSRELLYTAMTRAAKKLDIFGSHAILRSAPLKSVVRKRYTNFVKLMKEHKTGSKILKVLGEK